MQVDVALLVAAPNLRVRGDMWFLFLDEEGELKLPIFSLSEEKTCFEAAAALLIRYTGLEALDGTKGWIPLKQTCIWEKPLTICYGCFIPELTPLHTPAHWLTVRDLHERKPAQLEILSRIAMNL